MSLTTGATYMPLHYSCTYVTNSQCYMPLYYIIIIDAILCIGGSAELVRVLNRFRACVSLDGHNHISTQTVTIRMLRGIQSQLTPHTLTLLSIDNIDPMQINAMVSALYAKCSWHGTSVECAQPLPTSSILCGEEMISPPSTPKPAPQAHQWSNTLINGEGH